ncbi:type II toxin-antitoxin system mRNA interferase toxin, RelE/StbE family, partial [Salmonella enterica subsp. enterica serovar Enteritidis]|nr:type II toxin-antitoxin system mRNA interferase toxin, RelE/StbE family [Salmonella enterica subsp. enterica serovar Enteritidis]
LIGKILKGDKAEFIRYRIGDYRLIATIEDERLLILALSIGHRKDIYKHF